MATSNGQRIGILIITGVMIFGTLGSFGLMILQNDNQAATAAEQNKQQEEFQAKYAEYQKKVDAQAAELSAKYYDEFKQYQSRVGEFDREGVNEVKTEDLKEGDGEVIGEGTEYSAYYIGWNPKGIVFDQSIEGEKLKSPIGSTGLIEGWTEGMKGMKISGVREITIPSDKAYKEQGSGDDIPPNTPIKFVVMAIPKPAEIPMPDFMMNGAM